MGDWRGWVAEQVGPRACVVAARRLHGGITSTVHAVDLIDRDGDRRRLVLRRYIAGGLVRPDEAPELVDREVAALDVLEGAEVPASPRLVAADRDGTRLGWPGVLSTRLPGTPLLGPAEPLRWAEQVGERVVELLRVLRRVDATALGTYESWRRTDADGLVVPPRWVRDPAVWASAMARLAGGAEPVSRSPRQAIHRDLHPGNLLWSRRRITGVVDWVHLCAGPVEQDIGHCRLNIWLLAGRAAADRFLRVVEAGGIAYDHAWDLAVLAGTGDYVDSLLAANAVGADLTRAVVRRRAEAFLRSSSA